MLTRPISEEQRREFLQATGSQLDKLDFLIQAMVKTSRLEAGVITLEKKDALIEETLVNAINGILAPMEKKNIELTVDCPEGLTISHDSRWTSEALFNLLDNAVKYTPAGGSIHVSVQNWEMYWKIDVAADGEEGFPGNITCKVLMKLTDDNAIDIRYEAETDKPTIVNMTNHSYFNLDGDAASNADHLLMVDADYYTPVDSTFMTTGEIVPVEGTPMDFRTPTPVGARINDYDFVQLKNGNGYDHNWVLNAKGDISRKCVSLESPKTGIVLDVYTNEPGIQVYAGNFLDGSLTGKKGITYNQRASVCLETQKYPDTPNKPEWPSAAGLCGKQAGGKVRGT